MPTPGSQSRILHGGAASLPARAAAVMELASRLDSGSMLSIPLPRKPGQDPPELHLVRRLAASESGDFFLATQSLHRCAPTQLGSL